MLRAAPYMMYRSKQTGFRFFAYLSSLFLECFFMFSAALLVGRPVGNMLISLRPVGEETFQMFVP